MAKADRLLVGLGNPGAEYEGTRHNVGFAVIDALAERGRIALRYDGRADAYLGEGRLRGRPVTLVKPQTYMNRSGDAVQHLAKRWGVGPEAIFVIYDDINLPLGTLRLRERGSAGGHNGIQDIIDQLGTDAFPRLRIGISSAFERGQQANYVLSPFGAAEQEQAADAIRRARDAAGTFVTDGLTTAMNRFNS